MKSLARAFVLLLLLAPAPLYAQVTLRGMVVDSLNTEPLVGANVMVAGTSLGGATNLEGKFVIQRVPRGAVELRVTYIGYAPKNVRVTVDDDQWLVIKLHPTEIEGQEVVVTGQLRGQMAAMNQQITSNTIVNVVSEEKIKELPDANAAEAIGRLPGVSIIRSGGEANKVVLRGMADKFTAFTLDGVRIPATDADTRGVDLSMFSQGTLAGVEVFKALTPDKDGDAIAGAINMVTKTAPSVRSIRIDAKGVYSGLTKNAGQYDINGNYGERFLGDLLGVQVTGNIERRDRSRESFSASVSNSNVFLGKGWQYSDFEVQFNDEIRKRSGASLLLDVATPDNGVIRFNNIYSRTERNYTITTRSYPYSDYVNYGGQTTDNVLNTFSSSLRGENNLWGMNEIWGLSFAQSKAETPFDYRMSFEEVSIYDSINNVFAGMKPLPGSILNGPLESWPGYAYNNFSHVQLDTANYDMSKNLDREKTVFLDLERAYDINTDISGKVKIGAKYRYKSRFREASEMYAPYYLGYYQYYTRSADGSIAPKNFAGTRFANLLRDNHIILLPNFLDSPVKTRNLYGKYLLNPVINGDAMREWYQLNKAGVSQTGTNEYYDNPEIAADYYDITERVAAGYAMNTTNFGTALTLIFGVRVESERNTYVSRYTDYALSGFPTTGTLSDTSSSYNEVDVMPHLHLTWRPTDFMSVRLAGYRAIARPDFDSRLMKMVARVTNPRNPLVVGNPDLKNAKSWNAEIGTSFYGTNIGLFTVSGFYREITDMFHTVSGIIGTYNPGVKSSLLDTLGITWRQSFPANSPITLTYSFNSPRPTKVWGVEFEHQANLTFLPGFLSNLVFSWNLSLVRSETFMLSYGRDTTYRQVGPIRVPIYGTHIVYVKQKLENQPEMFGNAALGYDYKGFSTRLSLFYQGDYYRSYSGDAAVNPEQQSYVRLDLTMKQRITPNLSVFMNVNNLTSTAEEVFSVNGPDNWRALRSGQLYGLTGDLGVRVEF
jgi:TonB-dependent receptor